MTTSGSIHYGVQIDISDITTDNDASIGLYAGYVRWVTERPGYDGVTVVPTGDNDGNVWKEGIITDCKDLGQANRLIDILEGGNYGTLSGFTLSVDNVIHAAGTGDSLSDILLDNDYFMINRKVQFYVIIDDVFYDTWSGVVSNVGNTELRFSIQCEDDSKKIHKAFPPQIITKEVFPNLQSKTEGKVIPVCFGLVNNAKLMNISTKNEAINVLSTSDSTYKSAPILDYDSDDKEIIILTGNTQFQADELNDMSLRHIGDGDDQVLKITDSTVSSWDSTYNSYKNTLTLEGELSETPVEYPSDSDEKGSFVEIFNFNSIYIVSNEAINEFFQSTQNTLTYLKYWENDTGEWVDVSEILEESNLTTLEDFGLIGVDYPGVRVLSKVIDFEGNYSKLTTFTPKAAKIDLNVDSYAVTTSDFVDGTDNENLRNFSKDSSQQISLVRNGGELMVINFIIEVPNDLLESDYEKVYLLMDLDFEVDQSVNLHDPATNECYPRDAFSLEKDGEGEGIISTETLTAGVPREIRLIPGSHYNNGEGKTDLFNDIKDNLDISSFFSTSRSFRSYPQVRFAVALNIDTIFGVTVTDVDFYEVAFAIEKTINVVSEDIYTKVNGETTGAHYTDNVAKCFEHILEDYDGIAVSAIDYNELVDHRVTWKAGRQITERKNSIEYLRELASQSFVGIYPTRDGKRGFKVFRADTDFASVVHATDNGTIVENSISKWEKSDINKVYNDFHLEYDWNPARKECEQSIFIHNADQSAFPDELATQGTGDVTSADPTVSFTSIHIVTKDWVTLDAIFLMADTSALELGQAVSYVNTTTLEKSFYYGTITVIDANVAIVVTFDNKEGFVDGDSSVAGNLYNHYSSIPVWKQWVGGYTDYNTASGKWTVCRNSYLRSLRLNPLPERLSKCKWYIEESKFYNNSPGDNSTAHKYLDELIEWTTRQKRIVEYEIPITATNLALEMLTAVTFRDAKYTGGDDRYGYITKIKINPAKDTITIEATLEPTDIDDITGCNIQETGTATDTIQETGSQTDDYQETGDC